ncbi:unnamed protein product [Photorhabdus laumondii subsp. laumondii TTO1]|uniref:Photorhabdus luminescens subsp. laumondii TTO1 complete genome segment 7/17 n=1 Tax=Photorhabdus laumondii subsp. laumondii (strain DSM 15139 / CIP 105565 / TT01) TaxID=243265 RepID=Q7N5N9_PHOLL|nr:unnamed protein product [Photorhabdus laumondii subsp. laumondii TTO1]
MFLEDSNIPEVVSEVKYRQTAGYRAKRCEGINCGVFRSQCRHLIPSTLTKWIKH